MRETPASAPVLSAASAVPISPAGNSVANITNASSMDTIRFIIHAPSLSLSRRFAHMIFNYTPIS